MGDSIITTIKQMNYMGGNKLQLPGVCQAFQALKKLAPFLETPNFLTLIFLIKLIQKYGLCGY
jgi:hypothetical protein